MVDLAAAAAGYRLASDALAEQERELAAAAAAAAVDAGAQLQPAPEPAVAAVAARDPFVILTRKQRRAAHAARLQRLPPSLPMPVCYAPRSSAAAPLLSQGCGATTVTAVRGVADCGGPQQQIRSRAVDCVWNGVGLGGGEIRG